MIKTLTNLVNNLSNRVMPEYRGQGVAQELQFQQ